jgi:glutamate--cysteine ligase
VATISDPALDAPLTRADDLFHVFHEAEKPSSKFRCGAEMEKPGVFRADAAPFPYEGERGVRVILEKLEADFGWKADRETEGGPLIALLRKGASITLEPGAQLELSGAPLVTMHEIADELDEHIAEIRPISEQLGCTWLGLGFHPFARREDLAFVPKQRYGIMREYLPTRGGHALDMMLRTSTVQANYDYENEADAVRKLGVALRLSPLTTALFANSPWKEKARWGGATYRGRVWLDVDPDRSGLVPAMWGKGASYAAYVEWALDVPMFLIKRGGKPILNTGQTFRAFWKDGFEGHRATLGDWQTHLNTLFPEVRLKRTIEIRGADSQSSALAVALPALWTGILYDHRALSEAEALVDGWTHDEVSASRPAIAQLGVRASFRGRPLHEVGSRLVEIAEGGLQRRALKRADGRDESVHLEPLKALVTRGRSPADELLERATSDDPLEVIKLTSLL